MKWRLWGKEETKMSGMSGAVGVRRDAKAHGYTIKCVDVLGARG